MGIALEIDCDSRNAVDQDKLQHAPVGFVTSMKLDGTELKEKWEVEKSKKLHEKAPASYVAVLRRLDWSGDVKAPIRLYLSVPATNAETVLTKSSKMEKKEIEVAFEIWRFDDSSNEWVKYIFEPDNKAVKGSLLGAIAIDTTVYSPGQAMFPVDLELAPNGKDVSKLTRHGQGKNKIVQEWGVKKKG